MATDYDRYSLGGINISNDNVSYYMKRSFMSAVNDEYGKYADSKTIYDTTVTYNERAM